MRGRSDYGNELVRLPTEAGLGGVAAHKSIDNSPTVARPLVCHLRLAFQYVVCVFRVAYLVNGQIRKIQVPRAQVVGDVRTYDSRSL